MTKTLESARLEQRSPVPSTPSPPPISAPPEPVSTMDRAAERPAFSLLFDTTHRRYTTLDILKEDSRYHDALARLTPDQADKIGIINQQIKRGWKVFIYEYKPLTTGRRSAFARIITPLGWSITKDGNLLLHAYNETRQFRTYRMSMLDGFVRQSSKHGDKGPYPNAYKVEHLQEIHCL